MAGAPTVVRALGAMLAVLALAATASQAQVYHWIDDTGTAHYTDRAEEVPPRYRHQLEEGYRPETKPGGANFVVVPGINGPAGQDGEAVSPPDAEAFEARAQEALASQGSAGGLRLDPKAVPSFDELLRMGAPIIAGVILGALGMIAIFLAIGALILNVSCRLLGESGPGLLKGFGVVLVQGVASGAAGFLIGVLLPQGPGGYEIQAGQFSLGFLINAAILRGMVLDSFPKSMAVNALYLLIQLGIGIGLGLLAVFLIGF